MLLRVLLVIVGIALIGGVALALRGAVPAVARDAGGSGVTVECTGWTGVSVGCADWGAAVLAEGPPSSTFEMEDVNRLVLDRPTFGFAGSCEARYFLSRYPDEPAWTEPIPCLTAE